MQFRGPEANIGDAIQKLDGDNDAACRHMPAWQQALQARTPAALRRALEAGRRARQGRRQERRRRDPRRLAGRPHVPLDGVERGTSGAASASTTWSMSKRRRGQNRRDQAEERSTARQGRHRHGAQVAARRSCGCARRCKARRWCWRTRPAASWRWPAASPIRSASSTGVADPAPARLGDEAAHLPDRAASRTAAEHAGARRSDHAAADRQRHRRPRHDQPRLRRLCASAGFLVAAQCRLQHRRHVHHAARAGEFGQRRDRASARRRHQRRSGEESRRMFAPPRSPRKSTPNAFAIIRSCSARNRCA